MRVAAGQSKATGTAPDRLRALARAARVQVGGYFAGDSAAARPVELLIPGL